MTVTLWLNLVVAVFGRSDRMGNLFELGLRLYCNRCDEFDCAEPTRESIGRRNA